MSSAPVFRTMREQIADRIRTDVLAGRFEEGASLREASLAKEYGVSRAPIRDALLQLTQEGILVAKPNCGVRVGERPDETLQPLIVELRRNVEVFALQKGIVKMTEDDFDALDASVEDLRKACKEKDLSRMVECDMSFHRHIIESAEDPELVALWLPIVSRMFLHYSRHTTILDSYREHAKIAKAIRQRDCKAASKALLENIQ